MDSRPIIDTITDALSHSTRVYYDYIPPEYPVNCLDVWGVWIILFILYGPWVIIILGVMINDFVNKHKKTADEQR